MSIHTIMIYNLCITIFRLSSLRKELICLQQEAPSIWGQFYRSSLFLVWVLLMEDCAELGISKAMTKFCPFAAVGWFCSSSLES